MMEPSEERGFMLTDEIVSDTNALASTGKLFSVGLFRTCGTESSALSQTHELINGLGKGKSVSSGSSGEFLTWKSDYGRVVCSSFSSVVVDSKTFSSRDGSVHSPADSSTTGSNLGRLADYRDSSSNILFSSSVRAKRARGMNLNSQIPLCQVFGCNMDLSFSKDYHKRHKVCEPHSKTAKVTVDGLEQRFCQQCSRFHLLSEFDDGKRSCRKRLACHNERRRKPQIDHKSGHNVMETTLAAQTAFLCPDILSAGIVHEVKDENISRGHSHVKVEDEAIYNYHPPSLIFNQYDADKQLFSLYPSSSICCGYSHNLAGVSPITKTLSGNEGIYVTHGLSNVSNSGCAHSLLSTQPHNSFSSSGVPIGSSPLFMHREPGSAQNNGVNQSSETLVISLQGSTSVASNRFSSSGGNSMDDDHLGALLTSDASNTNLEGQADGIVNPSDYMN